MYHLNKGLDVNPNIMVTNLFYKTCTQNQQKTVFMIFPKSTILKDQPIHHV